MPKIGSPTELTVTPERHLVSFQVQHPIDGKYVCDATFRHRQVLKDGTVVEQHDEGVTVQEDAILKMDNAPLIIETIKNFLHAAKDAAESSK